MAPAGKARFALQVSERLVDRPLVHVAQRRAHVVVADRKQDRHALGRRERQIQRRHRRGAAHPPKHAPINRAAPPHQRQKASALNRLSGLEPERLDTCPAPHAADLAPTGVVVLDPGRHPQLVIDNLAAVRAQLPDRQHAQPPLGRGHKTDTSPRESMVTGGRAAPAQTAAIAGQKRPHAAARGRQLHAQECLVIKGSPVRVRRRAPQKTPLSRWGFLVPARRTGAECGDWATSETHSLRSPPGGSRQAADRGYRRGRESVGVGDNGFGFGERRANSPDERWRARTVSPPARHAPRLGT